jgi:hypothetical protein
MIAYHWAPQLLRPSIKKHGLLVPSKHPRLTQPTTCSGGHRNSHISLGKTPLVAWSLSGGFLLRRAKEQGEENPTEYIPLGWDLWQVNLDGIRYETTGRAHGEITVRSDLTKRRLTWLAHRWSVD